jgi:hypothetical protein
MQTRWLRSPVHADMKKNSSCSKVLQEAGREGASVQIKD